MRNQALFHTGPTMQALFTERSISEMLEWLIAVHRTIANFQTVQQV